MGKAAKDWLGTIGKVIAIIVPVFALLGVLQDVRIKAIAEAYTPLVRTQQLEQKVEEEIRVRRETDQHIADMLREAQFSSTTNHIELTHRIDMVLQYVVGLSNYLHSVKLQREAGGYAF